jgi:hypothetical protein
MLSPRPVGWLSIVAALLVSIPAQAGPGDCRGLVSLTLPEVTIARAEPIAAGSFSPPAGKPIAGLPAFCRVAGAIRPSPDSDIEFEVWMPSAGWNGKFEGAGNGGFGGRISYEAMAAALRRGYATASTDTGHRSGDATDAAWALGHPEKIVDFGYRAIHETAVAARAVIRAFYGEALRRAYFSSCSNGGRQALMEAQRYPEDYDGIIAGAPANFWTHLLAKGGWDLNALTADKESYIPAAKLPAIQAAALAACDGLDGVKDGTIGDAAACHFDPSVLLCPGPDSPACLTAPQLIALKRLYAGPRTASGQPFFPGFSPGGEAEGGGWGPWITGPAPGQSLMQAFVTQFFGNMVFGNSTWDFRSFNLDRDAKAADDKLAGVLNAADPDLRGFRARGGKLLLYHGWSDAAIPARSTIAYYESVVAKAGKRDADSFVRLFMVPGMQHCTGGTGATEFGQTGASAGDADHDITAALERWVERGLAPERIVAVKYKNPPGPTSEVARSRPLCAYPLIAKYKGSGSTDEAANFACVAPGVPVK